MFIPASNASTLFSQFTALPRSVLRHIQRPSSLSNPSSVLAHLASRQRQSLTPFSSVRNNQPSINLYEKVCILPNRPQSIKPIPVCPFETPPVSKVEPCSSKKEFSSSYLLVFLLLGATFLLNLKESNAKEDIDDESRRMYNLLKKDPNLRTLNEKIELFNYILRKGEEEALKAKNKDIVMVFGSTGAGKSTLVNFLFGCQMKKDSNGVIVDPKSPIKEVAKIGIKGPSCTFIPQKLPDITIPFLDDAPITPDNAPLRKECTLTIYDMAGLDDNRGIEVALANTIVAKKLLQNAKSARLVMVVEESTIRALKGIIWKEAILQLENSFEKNVGTSKRSLCVIVTDRGENKKNIDLIKSDIKKYTPSHNIDLSSFARTYDPLNPIDRDDLLETFRKMKVYKNLHSKITMGSTQLWDALKLGEMVRDEVQNHLKTGKECELDKAIKKVEFTYGIANLDNTDLKKPHHVVEEALLKYANTYLNDISPKDDPPIENQIEAFKNYKKFKEKFGRFVDFSSSDKQVRVMIKRTSGKRWIKWNEPQAAVVATVSTTALVAASVLSGGLLLPVLAAGAGVADLYAIYRYKNASQKESDLSEFFEGP